MARVAGSGRRSATPLTLTLALVLSVLSLAPVTNAQAPEGPPSTRNEAPRAEYAPNEVLVRFEPGTPADDRARARQEHGLQHRENLPLEGLERAAYNGNQSPPEKAAQVARNPNVRYAHPNHVWYPASDDPEYPSQWGFHNTGQTGGIADADIDLPEARTVASGSENQVVAVIDTGVQATHPDLAPHIWTNPFETPGNGIDDEGNGFVDDVHGWDFYNGDASVYDEADMDDHGTHVAGTIAAVSDNQQHVAGTTNARILPLKFLGPDGGLTSDAVLALDYVLDMKARGVPVNVTNNSWGAGGADPSLEAKIAEAGAAGVLFVAAAGNGGDDGVGDDTDATPDYPSSFPGANIVSVAATTHTDGLASFSNFGATSVDLGAPGASILSTVPGFGKAILADAGYRSALHAFGLEGVPDPGDREALLETALTWTATGPTDPVLVVDDDEGQGFQTAYTGTLSALGYTDVDVHTVPTRGPPGSRTGPDAATMAGYDVVIWFVGADHDSTLLAGDESALTTHLDAGGNLLLFGQDVGYDLTGDGASENAFLRDRLRADYLTDADFNHRPVGVAGTPYAGVPTIELDPSNPADVPEGQRWSSAFIPRPGAVAALRGGPTDYLSGTSMAAPHVSAAAAQVFASYPGIAHPAVKTRLMTQGDAVPSLDGKTVSGKRLNLAGALDTPGAPVVSPLDVDPTSFRPPEETTTLTWTQNEPAQVTVTVTPDGSTTPIRTDVLGATASDTHTWTWDGKDDGGTTQPSGSYSVEATAVDVSTLPGSASVDVSIPEPVSRFEETAPAFVFGGDWFTFSHSSRSGGSAALTDAAGASVEVAFTGTAVRWIGTIGPQRGIAQVSIDGVDHGTVDLYAPAYDTQAVPFTATGLEDTVHTLTITNTGDKHPDSSRTRIEVDAVEAAAVETSDIAPLSRFEETAPAFVFGGDWFTFSHSSRSGGSAALTDAAGASVEVGFTGTAVRWIATIGPGRGIAQISIDGVDQGTVDLYAPSYSTQQVAFTTSGLDDTAHTIAVTNTGDKHPDSSAPRVEMDAVEAPGDLDLTRFEQTDAAFLFGGDWFSFSHASRSGGSAALSDQAGASVEVGFTGTAVRWIGTTGPARGIAQVSIDGVDQGTVDLYAPSYTTQAVPFTATGLADGDHTITITNTGDAHPDSSAPRVEMDAVEAAGISGG